MTKARFKTKIEFTRKRDEVIIPLHTIGVNDRFQYARFTVKCLEMYGSATVFAGFGLQVGKDDTWATWINIAGNWHEGESYTCLLYTSPSPRDRG